MNTSTEGPSESRSAVYRAVWRWHFYAGLLCSPVLLLLGVTGAIYLFKPYVEPVLYRSLWTVEAVENRVSPAEQIASAVASVPSSTAAGYQFPASATAAAAVDVRSPSGRLRVYVHPGTGDVLGALDRDGMLMRKVRKLHGELLSGTAGTLVVEAVASWTFVLVATGLFLGWPRPATRVWGVWLPRVTAGGRIFWRDLHVTAGLYGSAAILLLLVSGLPWTNVWGGAFARVQRVAGLAPPPAASFRTTATASPADGRVALTLAEVVARTHEFGPTAGREVRPPRGPSGVFKITTGHDGPLATQSHTLIDPYSGDLINAADWSDMPWLAKLKAAGIRLHQGELFGLPNLLLMLAAAGATVLLTLSGVMMWWRRRPAGTLGVPPAGGNLPTAAVVVLAGLALLLPMLAASLIVIALLETIIIRLSPRASRFLGLST